jgi:uncharacterized protein (TIGR02246 family)
MMSQDEAQIRALVQAWHAATQAGDTARVLSLMTEDVLFLLPGRPPMNKIEFAALSTPASAADRPKVCVSQEIHELDIAGSMAYMRSSLTVTISPSSGAEVIERHGSTLTIFKKLAGQWLLARDANLLAVRLTQA